MPDSWRDTDPRNACACGRRKSPEAGCCQRCHMQRVHKRRKAKARARDWIRRGLAGEEVAFRPGAGMTNRDFEAVLRDVLI